MYTCVDRTARQRPATTTRVAGTPVFFRTSVLVWMLLLCCSTVATATAQSDRRPTRVAAPKIDVSKSEGIFFSDARSTLQGSLPSRQAAMNTSGSTTQAGGAGKSVESGSMQGEPDSDTFAKLISPASLEDLIKGSKLRLDRVVTTQPAFVGGGFAVARREFSLLALLFAIVEEYPEQVRWKSSAAAARELMARVAANTKIGSFQVYREAKNRMLDLGDLVSGTQLAHEAKSAADWSQLIDRAPLMQLLEWAHDEHVSIYSASQAAFDKENAALLRYAELIAVLGQASLQEEMPDATDADYQGFAKEMIAAALEVRLAVETSNAELARAASSRIGQSCQNCHDNFR